ncbi:hypothetical protein COCMIDRAFT_85931 [Bipolaris oryzae ATCC 44560]|uniref:Uncharacterized protein n=1 Tax=Bipolaris oryzae ATCC 44560 TaxID=930090 RepID=W6ZGD0_COCMI|nr:uncharacterized protein COCMIDRAFT_85931 [Bipolaris oryzae ATCC 44560]EUC48938.1 hypothetical protein COCMIDRAFT_85931 [Bipolaris oryzae ATCC 44560]
MEIYCDYYTIASPELKRKHNQIPYHLHQSFWNQASPTILFAEALSSGFQHSILPAILPTLLISSLLKSRLFYPS